MTANRQQRRAAAKNKMAEAKIKVTIKGNLYEIGMLDLSGKDAMDFRRITAQMLGGEGLSLSDLFIKGAVDLEHVAGVVWAYRRRWEKDLTYVDVLEEIDMTCLEGMTLDDGKEDVEDTPAPYAIDVGPGALVHPEGNGAGALSSPSSAPPTD